jgi:hypothetical protein
MTCLHSAALAQIAGLQWLIKQYDHGINAILADEVRDKLRDELCSFCNS